MSAPGYWMHETSGVLIATVKRYLEGRILEPSEVRWMRLYCKQWIESPVWQENPYGTEQLKQLRESVDSITDNATLSAWLQKAEGAGMDPL